ncbi:hypothetical protein CCR75_008890 [Bremia lactucae]|uniref:Uncharacterized protein n=1 Tax=Bremia lactucae TaxID=4779 RepID=A0A976FK27_BRELC|nr:hypothetical protein CCR75_008890 [Bremia lactucae]
MSRERVARIESVHDKSEAVDEAVLFDQITVNAAKVNLVDKQPSLLRKPGNIDGVTATILLDCGASTM